MLATESMKKEYLLKIPPPCFTFIAVVASLLLLASPAATSFAQVEPAATSSEEQVEAKVAEALKELISSMEMAPFSYQTENRGDPFEPFISERVLQETAETKPEELTGMRQFEPGQLTLVAIMFTEDSPMAMVEDSSHKGYIIRKGTKIGKSGIIANILRNQVIIKQQSYSMTQKKKYNTLEMILRKEGEK